VRLQTSSATDAMAEMFDAQAGAVESFVRGLPVADGQVGAVFILNGEPLGVDLFDCPGTFRSLFPKILRGYALDAIDDRSSRVLREFISAVAIEEGVTRGKQFMRAVLDAGRKPFDAPGVGATWRLSAPQVSGGGLTFNGNVGPHVGLSCMRRPGLRTLEPGELLPA
jgi:hypothetical protein